MLVIKIAVHAIVLLCVVYALGYTAHEKNHVWMWAITLDLASVFPLL